MAFDGSGVFLRLRNWVADATAGVKIRADFHDLEDDNFAAGLSQCITKDGQTTVTQNIPMNSKRITALADPIDPQDAATKAYAAPLAGGVPFTGDVIVQSTDLSNSIVGQKTGKNRWEIVLGNATPETGSDVGSDFQLINYADAGTLIGDVLFGARSTGLLTVKGNPTAALGIATKQYADLKMPLTGGTITGNLATTGSLATGSNVLFFGAIGSAGYIQWNGGGTYTLAGGGTIWHSGNFSATSAFSNARMPYAGFPGVGAPGQFEPLFGAFVTGWQTVDFGAFVAANAYKMRYLQFYFGTTWWTCGYS